VGKGREGGSVWVFLAEMVWFEGRGARVREVVDKVSR
jgi:hypothetical protein